MKDLNEELERKEQEKAEKRTFILSEETKDKIYDYAFHGMDHNQILVLLDDEKVAEYNQVFIKTYLKGRMAGKFELNKLIFENARKGNLRNAQKIFK
jgi:hypothetical protein